MSIKSTVKKLCPEFMLPLVRIPLDFIRRKKLTAAIEKYRKYYQDDLSGNILSDCEHFLMTGRRNVFVMRAAKEKWHYTRLAAFPIVQHWSGNFNADRYSGFVILDHDSPDSVEYTKNLFPLCGMSGKYRVMKLKDFLNGAHVRKDELIIASVKGSNFGEIKSYAGENNMPNDIVSTVFGKHDEIQYFDVFSPEGSEIVIDAGAYDGITALRFLEWGGEHIKKVYAFEMDPANFSACEANITSCGGKITLIKKGTWDRDETLSISSSTSGSSSSRISEEGEEKAYLTTIDSVVKDEPVTFIKMDVEGAELKSLKGARNTIIKHHPRLAICAYHKREDLYELPGYILSLVPEYKFYLRHYDSHEGEIVLYAYCE